jgi:hypothetical protein
MLTFAILILFYILPNHDFYLIHTYSTDPLTALDIFCVCEPPEDGSQTGPKHVVWEVHNKI